jgi:uncharacterized DUF497 family protein
MIFEWDENKNAGNIEKHGISFDKAKEIFLDPYYIVVEDEPHSLTEKRFYCTGKIGNDIITVRFTLRNNNVRIFGAGMWRKYKKYYEYKNNIL